MPERNEMGCTAPPVRDGRLAYTAQMQTASTT